MTNNLKKISPKDSYEYITRICKLANLSEVELIMTHLGHRPATAAAIPSDSRLEKNIDSIQKYALKIGLHMVVSKKLITDKKYVIEDQKNESHAGRIIFAFSKSKNKAALAAKYFYMKSFDNEISHKFGELMGYPDCCLDFGKYMCNPECDSSNFGYKNPAIESLKRSNKFDWHLNIFTTSLLSHFPCSLTCTKSIKYINKLFKYYDSVDEVYSKTLKNMLITPASLYWSWVDRILLYGFFKSNKLGTGEINYYKIGSMIYSKSFHQQNENGFDIKWKNIEEYLRQGNKLTVTDDSCIIYMNKKRIVEIKKNNKYIPLLIKPNIFPNETD